jgi:hypothetical protein
MQNESQNCGTFVILFDLFYLTWHRGNLNALPRPMWLNEHNILVEIFASFEI